jgi:hypothetical protein
METAKAEWIGGGNPRSPERCFWCNTPNGTWHATYCLYAHHRDGVNAPKPPLTDAEIRELMNPSLLKRETPRESEDRRGE